LWELLEDKDKYNDPRNQLVDYFIEATGHLVIEQFNGREFASQVPQELLHEYHDLLEAEMSDVVRFILVNKFVFLAASMIAEPPRTTPDDWSTEKVALANYCPQLLPVATFWQYWYQMRCI